ncbi:hypothetical protein EV175_000017 [Coemansia sp. RSA 1933]|nr:hypothetical protein EV175_000017 [Coemansia sp. RSA 1933]
MKDKPRDSQPASQIIHGSVDLKIITESEDVESDVREDVASILSLIKPSKSDESIAGEIVEQAMKTIEHGFKEPAQKAICPTLTNRMLIKYRDSFDVNNAIDAVFRLSRLNEEKFKNVSEADMYPLFSNLVMLVAYHAKQVVEGHSAGGSFKPKVTYKEGSMSVTPDLVLPLNDDKSGIGNRHRYYSRDDEEIDENGVNIIGTLTLRRLSSSIGPQGRQK